VNSITVNTNSVMVVQHRYSPNLSRSPAKGRIKYGIPSVVSAPLSRRQYQAYNEIDMIHKLWKFTLTNEFAEYFIHGDLPKLLNEVDRESVKESVNKTKELMPKIFSALSQFEESWGSSISDLYRYAAELNRLEALAISSHVILKIGGLFLALDGLNKLMYIGGKAMALKTMPTVQKNICQKLVAIFSLLALADDKRLGGETQELLSLTASVVHDLKRLIRTGLEMATTLDPHGKGTIFSTFLADVEKAMHLDVQQRLRQNDYLSKGAVHCSLCQGHIKENLGQGCYLTYASIFHIDCITCPSCNGPPRLVFVAGGKALVECSRCNFGSMMAFISQNFGQDFIILHSMSLLSVHLLWVAWASLANSLKPDVPFCMCSALKVHNETIS
jgi:hypothetical protein